MQLSLIEAIDMLTNASIEDVIHAIKDEYGEDAIDFITDDLEWLVTMLKQRGNND